MEQYALYIAIKNILVGLSNEYKYSFNDMDSNGKNVAGIYIKGTEPSDYRTLEDGRYYNYSCRLQVLIQGDNSNSSLMSVLGLAGKIRNTLSLASNGIYNTNSKIKRVGEDIVYDENDTLIGEDILVRLVKVDLLGEVDFKGKTGQGLPRYSINFKISYNVGGN